MYASVKILNYRIYLVEFLILFVTYFFTENCLSWFLLQNAHFSGVAIKGMSILVFPFLLLVCRYLKKSEQVYLAIFTVWLLVLVFRSMIEFQKNFAHFEIYTLLYPVIYVIFLKLIFRWLNVDLLNYMVGFHLLLYLAFMATFGRQFSLSLEHIALNTGPFSGDTRIIHAQSVLMLIIPYLWFLNNFILRHKTRDFLLFILCLAIIVIHQHRSVWSATILATVVYFFMLLRNNRKAIQGMAVFCTISFLLLVCVLYYISSVAPQILTFFSHRFNEILNPEQTNGTGSFRIAQTKAYMQYIVQKPFFGWTFDGYQLPNPLVDWWDSNTGHHFHQAYIETLFYHGIFGLLFKFSFLLYILRQAFSRALSNQSIILSAFCISGLIFAFSYVLPLMFWGHVALCLHYLENTSSKDTLTT